MRVALGVLVAAIVAPALLLGGWLTLQSAEAERQQLEQNLRLKSTGKSPEQSTF